MTGSKSTVSIIGYGRFGKVLATLLSKAYNVCVYDPALPSYAQLNMPSITATDFDTALSQDVIFLCVPIRAFETLIKTIAPRLKPGTTLIDTCSVKMHPAEIMQKYCDNSVKLINTHPMFGPDSVNSGKNLRIMMHALRCDAQTYQRWKNFFEKESMTIIELTPEAHDILAAQTQALTHFIGRSLGAFQTEPTPIDTQGYAQLLQIMNYTQHDSLDLFHDMIRFNPYAKETLKNFLTTATQTLTTLE